MPVKVISKQKLNKMKKQSKKTAKKKVVKSVSKSELHPYRMFFESKTQYKKAEAKANKGGLSVNQWLQGIVRNNLK